MEPMLSTINIMSTLGTSLMSFLEQINLGFILFRVFNPGMIAVKLGSSLPDF